MITFFNKMGNSWAAKIIFGLLALSMLAFWGLGGLSNVSRYDATNDAIQVGKAGISAAQLNQSFEAARKRLSQLAGEKYITPAKAIEMGVLDQVIQQEIAGLIQDQLNEDLGLTASNGAIQKYVENNPVFRDNTGKFDKNLFYAYLMQSGMNEQQLALQLKKELSFKHLSDTIEGLGYAPETLAKASFAFKNEKRSVDLIYATPDQVTIKTQPSQQDIQDYYEAYAEEFMNPEFRTITVAALTPDMMIDRIQIDPAEIEAAYEEQKDHYNKPEERDLYQMFFKDKAQAETVKAAITPENFEKTAIEKTSQSADETHFGMTAKNQLMEELAEPVFQAAENEIVGPIESKVGWHIVWVKKIKAAETTPAQEVKSKIKQTLALDQAYEKLEDLSRKLEDILGSGKDLSEAAKELNIPLKQIEKVDITGKLADGSAADSSYVNAEMLQNIFILKKGDTSALIQNGNGYLIAQLEEIIPVAPKDLNSVTDEIKALWTKEQQAKAFPEIMKELTEKAKTGTPLKSLSTEKGQFEFIAQDELMRGNTPPELAQAMNTLFTQEIGAEHAQMIPLNQGALIAIVHRIDKLDLTNKTAQIQIEAENTKQKLGNTMNQEALQNYTARKGIKINKQIIDQLIKTYQSQD